MPRRVPGLLLEDMLSALQRIDRYTTGVDRDRFLSDEKTIDAVVRNSERGTRNAECGAGSFRAWPGSAELPSVELGARIVKPETGRNADKGEAGLSNGMRP